MCPSGDPGSESEPDSRAERRPGANDITHADQPDWPFALDDRQVVDPVLAHERRGRGERRAQRDRDRLGGHPLPHPRLARVRPCRGCPQEVGSRQDADKAPVLGDGGRGAVLLEQPLGDLPKGVLRSDDERIR